MIITLAIVNGFSDEIQKKLVAFGSHISVNTFSGDSFTFPDEKLATLDTMHLEEVV
jgi:ABC-type lipoprotein release transport system permease subunit